MRNALALAAVVLTLSFAARAEGTAEEEITGIKVGAKAPELTGGKWLTADGKAPELAGKVYLIDFWQLE
jgi:hypothetical protein